VHASLCLGGAIAHDGQPIYVQSMATDERHVIS
jgi:hypothetical protein